MPLYSPMSSLRSSISCSLTFRSSPGSLLAEKISKHSVNRRYTLMMDSPSSNFLQLKTQLMAAHEHLCFISNAPRQNGSFHPWRMSVVLLCLTSNVHRKASTSPILTHRLDIGTTTWITPNGWSFYSRSLL